jgi:predicted enzyme related to lactoylglutathione lyase
MRIALNSVIVRDQDHALRFYTETLGFIKKTEIPVGDYKWLTVVSPADPDGTQLVLEPNAHPASAVYQNALFESGTPLTSFAVEDAQGEFERLKTLGVNFTMEPTDVGTAIIAVFDDTCGNFIQIYQES